MYNGLYYNIINTEDRKFHKRIFSVHCFIEHVRDTDMKKSTDFFLNPFCIML